MAMVMLTRSDLNMLRCSIKRSDPSPPETRRRFADQVQEILGSDNASDTLRKSAQKTDELIRATGWVEQTEVVQ